MTKSTINLITAFVLGKKRRKRLRQRMQRANYPFFHIRQNGYKECVWYPAYNGGDYSTEEPDLYNREGRRIRTFYSRDFVSCHNSPYDGGRVFMDRYNYALKNHFYVHREMLFPVGHPDRRYGALFESAGILPDDYRLFDEHLGLEKDFDLVFTFDRRLLDRLPNARFVPFSAGIKLDFQKRDFGLDLLVETENLYVRKTRLISMLSSDKRMCSLHELRIDTARKLRRAGLADGFGTFDPDLSYCRAFDTVAPYRFSVVFENVIDDFFFTEKITNCFACQTIPIYVGAPCIGDFFNLDGIISVRPERVSDLEGICRKATASFYEERLSAVLDNYRRVMDYTHPLTWMLEKHIEGFAK